MDREVKSVQGVETRQEDNSSCKISDTAVWGGAGWCKVWKCGHEKVPAHQVTHTHTHTLMTETAHEVCQASFLPAFYSNAFSAESDLAWDVPHIVTVTYVNTGRTFALCTIVLKGTI